MPCECTCQEAEAVCLMMDGEVVTCTEDWNAFCDPEPGTCLPDRDSTSVVFTVPAGDHELRLVHKAWLQYDTCCNPNDFDLDSVLFDPQP